MNNRHVWVEIKYTTLDDVAIRPDGQIDTLISVEAQEVADEDAKYGCWICELPLNSTTIDTECYPAKNN